MATSGLVDRTVFEFPGFVLCCLVCCDSVGRRWLVPWMCWGRSVKCVNYGKRPTWRK